MATLSKLRPDVFIDPELGPWHVSDESYAVFRLFSLSANAVFYAHRDNVADPSRWNFLLKQLLRGSERPSP